MKRAQPTGIAGIDLLPIRFFPDERGSQCEIYRAHWPGAFAAVQWNLCRSRAGVVRGAHVHPDFDEIYVLAEGHVLLGLHDIRPDSPTYRESMQLDWDAGDGFAVTVPRGVAHVMVCLADSLLTLGLSDYWRAERDNVGCQWDDPALGFSWTGVPPPVRSARDAGAPGYAGMEREYAALRRAETARAARHLALA